MSSELSDPDLASLVRLLRQRATDLPAVEAKAAGGGLPKSARETLSAFSNDRGGVLLLGLDEGSGFQPAAGFDAYRTQSPASRPKASPAVRTPAVVTATG